jgi:hypothetical protein
MFESLLERIDAALDSTGSNEPAPERLGASEQPSSDS